MQCVIDGGKQRRRDRHKAGFADGLGAVRPFGAAVFNKHCLNMREVARACHVIALQGGVERLAGLRVDFDLLAKDKPHALLQGATDLPAAEFGIDGLSYIMRGGVGCQAAEPSERVDLDLGKVSSGRAGVGRGLVSVGNENCAAAAVLVGGIVDDVAVGFAARGIGGDEHHAVLTGELACVAVHELCRVFKQQGLELLRRFLYGAAGDVDRAARVAAVVKAVVLCVALGKVNGVRGMESSSAAIFFSAATVPQPWSWMLQLKLAEPSSSNLAVTVHQSRRRG